MLYKFYKFNRWTITRPSLTSKEKQILCGVFAVYLIVGLFKAFCKDEDQVCNAYLLAEYVIKSLIMLGIIVTMNFNITHLRSTIYDSTWTISTPQSYDKLLMFVSFRYVK